MTFFSGNIRFLALNQNSLLIAFLLFFSSFHKLCFIDEDSNGAIDQEELRHCFDKLEISFTQEDINELFEACDINNDKGVEFKEFIVLLCLVCLLKDDPTALHTVS